MTWDELKEKAEEMGGFVCFNRRRNNEVIVMEWLTFCDNGDIFVDDDCGGEYKGATHRTPEQMLMIMRGLE